MIFGSIICLGDSLTYGSRDEYWRGYPVELELELYKRHGQNWNCINAGVPGEPSIDIYKRAYGVIKANPEASDLVLLMGTNDSKRDINTPPNMYRQHVDAVIRIGVRFGKMIYLCLIPDLSGFGAPDYCSQIRIDTYNAILNELADEYDCQLVDLRGLPKNMYSDGVHLNNLGYKTVAHNIADAIEKRRKYNGRA